MCVSYVTIGYASECTQAIQKIHTQEAIPKDILTAVALTETGVMQKGHLEPYPWAINVEGKGFLFSTKQKAIDAVNAYLKQGKTSIDIGCMQLNWYWHGQKFGHSVDKAFDPQTNIMVGAQYIKEHFKTYKNWDKAVARYHSGTSTFAQQYYQKYASNLKIARANLGIRSSIPINSDLVQDFSKDNDTDHDKRPAYTLAMLNKSAGALINFQATDGNKPIPFINLVKRPTKGIKRFNSPSLSGF
jgi:hypothetical protein